AARAAGGERDVERLLGQARAELLVRELSALAFQGLFTLLLGGVDPRPERLALFLGKRLERRLDGGQLARLADEAGFRVLEGRGIARRAERGERARDDALKVLQARRGASARGWL